MLCYISVISFVTLSNQCNIRLSMSIVFIVCNELMTHLCFLVYQ